MKINRTIFFFLTLIILLGVFMLNMTFAGSITPVMLTVIRIAFIIIFLAGWIILKRKGRKNISNLYFTLMALNLAFLVVSFFTTDLWGLNIESPKGIAIAKMSDSFIISAVIIISMMIAGFKPKDIYLSTGKFIPGLLIGIFSFIVLGFLAIKNPEQPIGTGFIKTNLIWILIFVLFNGFLEELIFRGIFLKQLNNYFKPVWSVILTAVVFGAAHLQVTYTPDVLFFVGITMVLGLIWGFIIHYTKSMLASVLFHAGADLVIIMPVYVSLGVAM